MTIAEPFDTTLASTPWHRTWGTNLNKTISGLLAGAAVVTGLAACSSGGPGVSAQGNAGSGPVTCVASVQEYAYGEYAVEWESADGSDCSSYFGTLKNAVNMGGITLSGSLPAGWAQICSVPSSGDATDVSSWADPGDFTAWGSEFLCSNAQAEAQASQQAPAQQTQQAQQQAQQQLAAQIQADISAAQKGDEVSDYATVLTQYKQDLATGDCGDAVTISEGGLANSEILAIDNLLADLHTGTSPSQSEQIKAVIPKAESTLSQVYTAANSITAQAYNNCGIGPIGPPNYTPSIGWNGYSGD
jgi:hypothetical protein